jgi:hypothetical protein
MRLAVGVAFITSLLAGTAAAQLSTSSHRCNGALIQTGSSPAQVRAACGGPSQVYSFTDWVQRSQRVGDRFVSLGQTVQVEQWTLQPEPGQFVTTLRFENGRLTQIVTGSRLPALEPSRELARCRQQMFRRHTPAGAVVLVCGEPDERNQWIEERVVGDRDQVSRVQVTRERWTYNYGPERFLRVFLFENGSLVEQSSGPRGF